MIANTKLTPKVLDPVHFCVLGGIRAFCSTNGVLLYRNENLVKNMCEKGIRRHDAHGTEAPKSGQGN